MNDERTYNLPASTVTPVNPPVGEGGTPEAMGEREPLKNGLSRDFVAKTLETRLRTAKDARAGHLEKWLNHNRLLNNDYDFSGKQKWQSKGYVPKLSKQAGRVIGVARKATTRDKDNWSSVDGTTDMGRLAAPVKTAIAYDCLDRSGFVKDLKPAIKAGLCSSAILYAVKPHPEPEYPGHTLVEPVDMRYIVRDPTGRGKWLFYTIAMDWADVARLAPAMKWDLKVVESLRDENAQDEDAQWKAALAQMLGQSDSDRTRKTVYLSEYYGDLSDEAGNEVYRFASAVLANGRHLLGDPIEQPYGDNEGCITGEDIDPSLGAPYGKAYLEDAAGPAEVQTRLYNMMFDHASGNVPMYVANRSDFLRPDQLKEGIKPGKIWELRVPPGPNSGIVKVDTNTFNGELMNLYALNGREIEDATGATEISRGATPQAGGKKITATEYSGKLEQASETLGDAVMDIEDRSFVPMWTRLLQMIGRYADLTDPRTIAVCRDALDDAMSDPRLMGEFYDPKVFDAVIAHIGKLREWEKQMQDADPEHFPDSVAPAPIPEHEMLLPDPATGQNAMLDAYLNAIQMLQDAIKEPNTVTVRSLSGYLDKAQKAERLGNLTAFLLGNPVMAQQVDPRKAFKALCVANDIDPEDLGPSDQEYSEMMEMQAAQQQAMAEQEAAMVGAEQEREDQGKEADHQRNLELEQTRGAMRGNGQGGR